MRGAERIAYLQAENASQASRSEGPAQAVGMVLARQYERKGPWRRGRHNSSKPPSTDSSTRKTRRQRIPSERKNGGQRGHPGVTLLLVERPDEVLKHRPARCTHCQHSLEEVAGEVTELRQVQDLSPWKVVRTKQAAGRQESIHLSGIPAISSSVVHHRPMK